MYLVMLQIFIRSSKFSTSKSWCRPLGFYRYLSSTSTSSVKKLENPAAPKRAWPRQGKLDIEAVTPPVSTSIASTSKEPLLKDIFAGRVQLELLEYPEVKTIDDVTKLSHLHERIKHVMLQIDSQTIDKECKLPQSVLTALASHGLFGMQIDPGYGGQGLNYTESARVWESAALDGAVLALLDAHNSLALQTISFAGTDEQKLRFLPDLTSGKDIAAFCLHEVSSGSDLEAITTIAVPSEDGRSYTLNGEKSWVTNGAIASKLIVFARVAIPGQDDPSFAAFLVDRNTPGVESGEVLDTLGMHGANVTKLLFYNVRVPAENMLGSPASTMQLAEKVFNYERLNLATACTGLLRYLLSYAAEHCLARHQFGRPLGEFGLIQAKLAQIALNLYAMESGVFYVTGLLDAQPSRDLSLEIGALKVFCSEALWSGVNQCIQMCGRIGLLKDVPFERYMRDSRSLLIHGTPNEVLRLWIAGSGLRHIGPETQEASEKGRYWVSNLGFMTKFQLNMLARKHGFFTHKAGAGPKVDEGGASPSLKDHLHFHLASSADQLALLTLRFRSLTEALLAMDGSTAARDQMTQERLADCAIDFFLLAIVLGRASRSISIGVHLHDFEIRLANSLARAISLRLNTDFGLHVIFDVDRRRIANEILAHRGYPVSHPLTRVW